MPEAIFAVEEGRWSLLCGKISVHRQLYSWKLPPQHCSPGVSGFGEVTLTYSRLDLLRKESYRGRDITLWSVFHWP